MAILDRPLFQRRLTKDELRMYGIPAFANGGIVKMSNGGDPLGLFTPGGKGQEIKEAKEAKPKVMLSDIMASPTESDSIANQIQRLETIIANKKANNPDADTSAEEAKIAELKKELVTAQQEEVKDIATPVPEDIRTAETTTQLKEAILKGKGPGQDEIIEEKTTNITDDLSDPEREVISELEALVKERSPIYKKILGDPKEGLKQQGLLQLAQFGLNLASARGGTFAEKIAKSAKDPLQAFAALGREAMKDERAIDMLAIKSAEAELARGQKVGNFGQLVQDIMNTKGLDRDEAAKEATKIYEQKSGKTVTELRTEAYNMYYEDFIERGEDIEDAQRMAKEAVERDFGITNANQDETTTTTTTTETDVIKID